MKGTIITIDEAGNETVREIDGEPKLALLQEGVGGGSIQIVPYFKSYRHNGRTVDCIALCDEEGKIDGQAFNETATKLWHEVLIGHGHPGLVDPDGRLADHLVGKIAIVFGDEAFMAAL